MFVIQLGGYLLGSPRPPAARLGDIRQPPSHGEESHDGRIIASLSPCSLTVVTYGIGSSIEVDQGQGDLPAGSTSRLAVQLCYKVRGRQRVSDDPTTDRLTAWT